MPLEIVTIPCLSDNYAYLIRCTETDQVAVVDVPDAAPILAELSKRGWPLHQILITHHHFDHIDGVAALQKATNAKTLGARADKDRLPDLDIEVGEGDTFKVGAESARVIEVDGHTIGHIAFLFENAKAAFSADSLMALGCGRLFEGTPDQMWDSLQKFMQLDDETLIYSGHEYTQSNAAFALTIEPDNEALQNRSAIIDMQRSQGLFTVPSSMQIEKATNPFLRAHLANVKSLIGLPNATDAEAFAKIRTQKDNF